MIIKVDVAAIDSPMTKNRIIPTYMRVVVEDVVSVVISATEKLVALKMAPGHEFHNSSDNLWMAYKGEVTNLLKPADGSNGAAVTTGELGELHHVGTTGMASNDYRRYMNVAGVEIRNKSQAVDLLLGQLMCQMLQVMPSPGIHHIDDTWQLANLIYSTGLVRIKNERDHRVTLTQPNGVEVERFFEYVDDKFSMKSMVRSRQLDLVTRITQRYTREQISDQHLNGFSQFNGLFETTVGCSNMMPNFGFAQGMYPGGQQMPGMQQQGRWSPQQQQQPTWTTHWPMF